MMAEAREVSKSRQEAADSEPDLYAREYDHISNELIANESMGDGRVSVFLGIWSASLAGVGAILANEAELGKLKLVMFVALVVVLALGVVTSVRISKRNYQTDKLIDALCRLRVLLCPTGDPVFYAALPWTDDSKADHELEAKARRPAVRHWGLLHVVHLANAATVAVGVLLALALVSGTWVEGQWLSLLAGGLTWVLQTTLAYVENTKEHGKREKKMRDFLAARSKP